MAEKALMNVAPVFLVADLGRSLVYYRDCLGFERDFAYGDFYAGVARDGCCVHLKCAPTPPRDQAAFDVAEHVDVCFGVLDANALAAELARRGAVFTVSRRAMPYGNEFYVRDPDGHVMAFVEAAGK